jgi:hypothetical protein
MMAEPNPTIFVIDDDGSARKSLSSVDELTAQAGALMHEETRRKKS